MTRLMEDHRNQPEEEEEEEEEEEREEEKERRRKKKKGVKESRREKEKKRRETSCNVKVVNITTHHSMKETKVSRHQVLKIVRNENPSHVHFDLIRGFSIFSE